MIFFVVEVIFDTMSTSSSGNSNKDNVFDLGSSAFASDHFRMHEFKVTVSNHITLPPVV